MITFWVVSAMLMAGALLFIVPPLLGGRVRLGGSADHQVANLSVLRDQLRELEGEHRAGEISDAQFEKARGELERRVLDESAAAESAVAGRPPTGLVATIVLLVPALAIPLYLYLGSPEALSPATVAARANEAEGHALTAEQVQAMVDKLAARLRETPDDAEGWIMLARSYNALGRYGDAAEAFRTLTRLLPADAQLLADYADTLAMSRGRQLSGEPESIITRALELDARNVKALALAGTAAFERADYAAAIGFWERIQTQVQPDSPTARSVAGSIAEARNRLGAAGGGVAAAATAAPQVSVSGRISADPSIADRLQPDDTVFVFARAVGGPRMPLAIVRKQVRDLPFDFTLDDSMAMTPAARLSSFQRVEVGARVSRSGNAMPQPGDIDIFSGAFDPHAATSVELVLGGGARLSAAAAKQPAPQREATSAPPPAGISGAVSLAPEVGARVAPTDTVFIFARAARGPRMPLAIVRRQVRDLPLEFSLDDSMAMTPNMRLSAFPEVVVGARVSRSGNAAPQAGDFEIVSKPVGSNTSGLELVISQEIH
ncbi:MAG: c-type cytochrome biogenesis protein CcmI [Rhodocyclaceae bacterium]|nr:c-type cytochrome biogenesis protein CcmI [Rhodocyclaceae bacterium]